MNQISKRNEINYAIVVPFFWCNKSFQTVKRSCLSARSVMPKVKKETRRPPRRRGAPPAAKSAAKAAAKAKADPKAKGQPKRAAAKRPRE